MRFKPKFLFFLILAFACNNAWAQVCTGSLGDPIVTEDFGSGSTPHVPITTYTREFGACPNDGSYSLTKTEQGCHDDTWHRLLKDHTGNDGYMMVVNASFDAGEFFKYPLQLGILCENTTYEFSAYILNLIKAGQFGFIKPNISFIIETPDGVQLKKYDTGDIPEVSDDNGWIKYGTFFTTPPSVTSVVIKMVNNAPGGNGNDLLLDDIAFRACGPVVQAGFSGDVSATERNLCVGNTASYQITSTSPTGYANPSYQWQQNINGSGWVDLAGRTNPVLQRDFNINDPVSSYQYRLGVAEGGNITSLNCRVYSNPVIININGFPDPPPIISPRSVCEGDQLILATSGGASYKWTAPDGTVSTGSSLSIQNVTTANAGRYDVDVISAAGCITPQHVDVVVNLKPVINTDPNPVNPICRGTGTQLTASVSVAGSYTYSWLPTTGLSNPNVANPFASPNNTTLYTVTVTNSVTGCFDTKQVQVEVLDEPVAHAGDDKKIFEGQAIKLDGSLAGDVQSYSWSPTEYLDNPNSLTPTANPPHDITYTLTVISANGCGTNADDVFLRVYQKIVIPSTFTPNNDGVNDIWNIEALETYPEGIISVFNRNGKQVFQSRGYGKPWDGKFNGEQLPAGTYYYVIDLKNDTPKLSGWVLIVR